MRDIGSPRGKGGGCGGLERHLGLSCEETVAWGEVIKHLKSDEMGDLSLIKNTAYR